MKMTKLPMTKWFLLAAAAAVSCGAAYAGDQEAGKKKAAEVCVTCHGADGNNANPQFPRLAGQHEDYILHALHDYKSGARKDPVMGAMAASLSPEDMENVAAWFSSQTTGLITKR